MQQQDSRGKAPQTAEIEGFLSIAVIESSGETSPGQEQM